MFFKKKPLKPTSTEFDGTTFAKSLMQQREVFAVENKKFREEMKIPAPRPRDETAISALEEAATMILGQRFHSLMLTQDNAYFDGTSTDPIPAAAALAVVLNMMLQITAALSSEGFQPTADFHRNAPADTVLAYLRFYPDEFKEQVLRQGFEISRMLEQGADANPNVAEMLDNIRTLTIASISGAQRVEDQSNKVDQAFNSIYSNLLTAIERPAQ